MSIRFCVQNTGHSNWKIHGHSSCEVVLVVNNIEKHTIIIQYNHNQITTFFDKIHASHIFYIYTMLFRTYFNSTHFIAIHI